MNVRTKFYVKMKTEFPSYGRDNKPLIATKVELTAIWDGADTDGKNKARENHILSEATPSADISLLLNNKEAADRFVTGKSYYVDFSPAV